MFWSGKREKKFTKCMKISKFAYYYAESAYSDATYSFSGQATFIKKRIPPQDHSINAHSGKNVLKSQFRLAFFCILSSE